MTTNLLTQLMDEFRGDATSGVASALGESPARTQMALGAVVAALIGGLAKKASTTDQAGNVLDLIKRNKLDSGAFTDVASAFKAPGGINSLIDAGRPLLDSVLGGRSAAVTDLVASHSGVSRSSSSSLLSLVAADRPWHDCQTGEQYGLECVEPDEAAGRPARVPAGCACRARWHPER